MVTEMKIDRLIGILTILIQNEKTTAPQLAERFEVSRRTILRDIDTLGEAGIPVYSMRGGSGGFSVTKDYKLTHSELTSDELNSLAAALRGLDSVSEQSNFDAVMRKLAPENAVFSSADSIIIDLSGHYKDSISEKIALIRQASAEKRTIAFDYYSPKGESRREIEPYSIEFRWQAWYVFGWCLERKDFRRFKMNRLWNLKLNKRQFFLRTVPPGISSAEDVFAEQNIIQIRFDKSVRFQLIEEYGPDSYEEDENSLLMTAGYTNKNYILSWVLGFGDKAEIMSPAELRTECEKTAEKMLEKYHT